MTCYLTMNMEGVTAHPNHTIEEGATIVSHKEQNKLEAYRAKLVTA